MPCALLSPKLSHSVGHELRVVFGEAGGQGPDERQPAAAGLGFQRACKDGGGPEGICLSKQGNCLFGEIMGGCRGDHWSLGAARIASMPASISAPRMSRSIASP